MAFQGSFPNAYTGIRPIAIFCAVHDGRLLAHAGHDPVAGRDFLRPPGGGMDFGEDSLTAVRRELKEELGFSTVDERLLGVLENRFSYKGQAGHEIVFVYGGRFAEPAAYARERFDGVEADGTALPMLWAPLERIRAGELILYPPGLLELL